MQLPVPALSPGDVSQTYHGEWNSHTPTATAHGTGIQQYHNGDTYHGTFEDDHRNGYGVYTWSNGDVYEGEWRYGVCHGTGMKRMENGSVYDGEWRDGMADGYGVKTFAFGLNTIADAGMGIGASVSAHMGYYKEDERCGLGLIVWTNGDEYEGDFNNGDPCGFGVYSYHWNPHAHAHPVIHRDVPDIETRSFYRGQWYKGQKHGPGYFKVYVQNACKIYFEMWYRGKCLCRQNMFTNEWRHHVPSIRLLERKQECLMQLKKNNNIY